MLAELTIVPIGKGVSVSGDVAKAVKIIDESGLDYRLNPMGTVMEGDIDQIFDVVKKCHEAVMRDSQRVLLTLNLDDRKDRPHPRLDKKVASVEKKVGRILKK
ncbi:MAG: MTH1187 family thiamine-binding protein [Candidatus Omnitrophica bacterium]|nr:MTH1187 family thiamine-binding protein [Candidatus Omnitrophota bacterium]